MGEVSFNPAGQLRAGAVLNYVIIGVQMVTAIAYTPVMLRMLGQQEYGIYSLVVAVIGYLSLLSLGFGGAYVRFYSRYAVAGDLVGLTRLNGMFILMFTAMGAIAAVVGVVLAGNAGVLLGKEFTADEVRIAQVLLLVLSLNVAVSFPVSVFASYMVAQERFVILKAIELIRVSLTPLLSIIVLAMGFKSVGLVIVTAGVSIGLGICTVLIAYCRLGMRFILRGLSPKLLGEVAVFSGYLFMNMIVEQVNWNVDRFIVGRFWGSEAVAVYGIGALFATQYLVFASAVSNVFTPRVHRMVATGSSSEELTAVFIRVGRLTLLILGLVLAAFWVFGSSFIRFWAGAAYADAYVIALLLMTPVTLALVQNLGVEIQKAKNMHQFRSWVYLAAAAANVLVSIPVARQFGGVGAAAVTGVTFLLAHGLVMNLHYVYRVGIDIRAFWGSLARLGASMLPAVLLGVVMRTGGWLDALPSFLISGVIFLVIFVGFVWRFGMNDDERALVRSVSCGGRSAVGR